MGNRLDAMLREAAKRSNMLFKHGVGFRIKKLGRLAGV